MRYTSYSPEETEKIAYEFSQRLNAGDVVCMYGELGAGKTAFVRGIARGLGIKDHITSPTFTIVNEYCGKMPLYHFDVYRIADEDEMYEIGYEEYIDGDGVSVIEWPQLIKDILPKSYYSVKIDRNYEAGENIRIITIERAGK